MEKLRKPDKAIFDITLKRLGVTAREAVFLDDLGGNLKMAKQMGMATIKVRETIKGDFYTPRYLTIGNRHC